ncbi:MAG: type II toxin-antitoxin system RelB/DinJ family antitoxin [Propionibacteriaceae bacterium]|nr:type II toxin-antitoxin system RelB/DinJ family antitoxin [Propionibacteriaceae bacterium]
MNATLTVRLDSDLKAKFTRVVESIGLDAPTVVRMLVKQTVNKGAIPLTLNADSDYEYSSGEEDTMRFMESIHAEWGPWSD